VLLGACGHVVPKRGRAAIGVAQRAGNVLRAQAGLNVDRCVEPAEAMGADLGYRSLPAQPRYLVPLPLRPRADRLDQRGRVGLQPAWLTRGIGVRPRARPGACPF